jgi:hypothetical protein
LIKLKAKKRKASAEMGSLSLARRKNLLKHITKQVKALTSLTTILRSQDSLPKMMTPTHR